MPRWRGVPVAVVLVSVLAAASLAAPAPGGAGSVKLALTVSPTSPDPHWNTQTSTRLIAAHVFEALVTPDESYRVIPQLAREWSVSADGLTWRFELRQGVRFHNGAEMTAEDVKASIERFMQVGARKGELAYVESVEAPGPYTVAVRLKRRVGTLLDDLANPLTLLAIMPKEIARAHIDQELDPTQIVGTGPYRLVEYRPDVRVRLERFDGYVPDTSRPGSGLGGEKRAYFQTVDFLPVREAASRLAGLETGAYDFAEGLPITSYQQVAGNARLVASVVKPQWGIYFEINAQEPPTNNRLFRQALLAALDMKGIMEVVTAGNPDFYRLQPGAFFPEQAQWHTTAGGQLYNHPDLGRVKSLLAQAGYKGEPVVIISNQGYDWMYRNTLAAFQQLRAAGINARLEFLDWASQLAKARSLKGWHLSQTGWSPRFSPTALAANLVCGGSNAYGYCNPEMDRLFEQFTGEVDAAKRRAIYEKIQTLMYEDAVVVRTGDYFGLNAYRAELKGYRSWYVVPRMWNVWRE